MSAKHKLSASVFITAFPPLSSPPLLSPPYVVFGRRLLASALQLPKLRQHLQTEAVLLWPQNDAKFREMKDVDKCFTALLKPKGRKDTNSNLWGRCIWWRVRCLINLLSCQTPTHKSELTDHIFTVLAASQPQLSASAMQTCSGYVCWPAGHVTQDAVVEEDVLLAIGVDLQGGDAGGIVVHHHDAGAVEPLGLVHEQVAPLVVHIICNDKALWKVEIRFELIYTINARESCFFAI